MNAIIGLWLICFAITILFVSLEPDFTVKEKVIGVLGFMTFLTILFVGVWFLVGGD